MLPISSVSAVESVLISRPGDQVRPAAAGSYVAFVDYGVKAGDPQLWFAKLGDPNVYAPIDESGDIVGSPDVSGTRVVYRIPGKVMLSDMAGSTTPVPYTALGSGKAVISTATVAWEQDDAAGGPATDVAWLGARGGTIVLTRSGAQRALAISDAWLAFLDESDGAVHLLDTANYTPPATPDGLAGGEEIVALPPSLAGGAVSEIALSAGGASGKPTVAVLCDAKGWAEAGVLLPEATLAGTVWNLAGLVDTATGKTNLHLFGDWVAFDETSDLGESVRLVNWRANRTFAPTWRGNAQTLSYVSGSDTEVRIVWTEAGEAAGSGLDVWEFTVALPLESGGGSTGGAVTCAQVVEPIGELELLPVGLLPVAPPADPGADDHGNDGWHVQETFAHDERWHGERVWRAWDWETLTGGSPARRRVVVCIDATNVASAWVGVGSEIVAAPSDFSSGTLSLEARLTIPAGTQSVGAVAIARKGGTLHVRVLDDPGGDVNGPAEGSTCSASGDCPSAPGGLLGRLGCASGGAGGVLSLLLVGLLVARPSRRRSRS